MKRFKTLFLFPLLAIEVFSSSLPRPNINSAMIEPYQENSGLQYLTLTIENHFQFFPPLSGKIKLQIDNGNIPQFTFHETANFMVEYNNDLVIDIPIPTNYYYEHHLSALITFEYGALKKIEIPIEMYSYAPKDIKITELEEHTYKKEKVCFQIKDNITIYEDEIFEFTSFEENVVFKNYYRLELDIFVFNYTYFMDFSFESAHLLFADPNNLFPLLEFEEEENKKIPLKIIDIGSNHKSLSFFKMYVDENYLWMSITNREGLSSTSYFYLPLNEQESIFGTKFSLVLKKMGKSANDYYFDFYYYFDHNLFGDCQTSDYCLVGGVN